MSTASGIETRQCVFCGYQIRVQARQCVKCRETQPESRTASPVRSSNRSSGQSSGHIRKGLLMILLASVVYYFTSGSSPLTIPAQLASPMLAYLMPTLYLAGFATSLWGLVARMRS